MKTTLIDFMAWRLIQVSALIQGAMYDFALRYTRDKEEFFKFMQYSLSGYYIFQMSLNDLPDMVRKKLLGMGRLMLFILIAVFIMGKVVSLLK